MSILGLTKRQVSRFVNRYRESGATGLALVHEHYSDLGPTLAAEKRREMRLNQRVSLFDIVADA